MTAAAVQGEPDLTVLTGQSKLQATGWLQRSQRELAADPVMRRHFDALMNGLQLKQDVNSLHFYSEGDDELDIVITSARTSKGFNLQMSDVVTGGQETIFQATGDQLSPDQTVAIITAAVQFNVFSQVYHDARAEH
jgi:hypothetical protein